VVQLDLELDEESSHSTAGTVGIGHLHVMAGKPSLLGRACVFKDAGSEPDFAQRIVEQCATLTHLRSLLG